MVALLIGLSEAVWVRSFVGSHGSGPCKRVSVISNPGGLVISFNLFALSWVLKAGVAWHIVQLLLLFRLFGEFFILIDNFWVEKSNLAIVWLQENGVFKEGPHVHGSLVA